MGAITHKSSNEKKRQDLRSTCSNTKIDDKDNSDGSSSLEHQNLLCSLSPSSSESWLWWQQQLKRQR